MNLRTPADIALLVKERRKRLGVSQHQLADRIGGSRQWVQKLEQGLPGLELGLTLRALQALGVMLDASNGPEQLTVAGAERNRGGQGLSVAAVASEASRSRDELSRATVLRPVKEAPRSRRLDGAAGIHDRRRNTPVRAADKSVRTRSDVVVQRERARQGPSAAPGMVFIDIDSIVDANRAREVVSTARVGNTAGATTRRR
ncbi:helix-turn-helix domain-containing protein [Gemmatimonas sp.]|uniref:helix-turn-helix domain-containing protein n=1 Tax=Gemmatimonas sp. TaxID=1962908 RepID=UPI0039837181